LWPISGRPIRRCSSGRVTRPVITGPEALPQTFALGSIFGFITNQGAYFYYTPADPLARPVKLAQGLANSLQVFIVKEGLVQEVRERVEQTVAGRGVEATLRLLRSYYEVSNGRYSPADELVLELKRLVRAYADELRQIHQFASGRIWPAGEARDEAHSEVNPELPYGH
jgi:hypothetical protein